MQTPSAVSYDPHPIRWIDLVLPHPEDKSRWLTLKADGPFALRHWYFAPGTKQEIRLHLDARTPEGGLTACLHCGQAPLYTRRKSRWGLGALACLPGLVLGYFLPVLGVVWVVLALALTWALGTEEIVCYHCGTQHRGFRQVPVHPGFQAAHSRASGTSQRA
ncbi:MAG: hypothetical protein H6830_08685 [Planctomycetes bacterium]|nr:hypothetical protein [Planctomycetota bacterium]